MRVSQLIRKEQCPKCAKRGNDTRGDNLAVYTDQHKWCYACGYYVPSPDSIETIKRRIEVTVSPPPAPNCPYLPSDISPNLSTAAIMWLSSYGMTPTVLEAYRVFTPQMSKFWWSPNREQLIYPIFDDGQLIFWTARNFNKKSPAKYLHYGSLQNHFHILGVGSAPLVVVEDIVSAIKVANNGFHSMPLFGAFLQDEKLIKLRDIVLPQTSPSYSDEIHFWLDPDKRDIAVKLSNHAKELGMKSTAIISRSDPKDHYPTDIKMIVRSQIRNDHAS